MILVVGGAHSGKRTFVREKLGFAADDFVDAAQLAEGGVPAAFAGRVAYRAEELVRELDADRALERLIGFDAVILPLVGSGVVPMRAEDAQWRERAGRLGCALAAHADVVVRMACGIPQVIKGNLADAPRGTQGAGAPLEVVFVRHGATAGTEDHRYSGAGTDEPLSSAGERALRELACDRDVFRVITSGMARTDQTARILFPNAELMACPGLREMDFGDFEGRSAAELKEDVRYRAWVDSWCETRCPHGEGKSDFTRRVVAAFREACESERAQGSGRAVFVVHAGTVKALLSELAVPKMGYFDVHTEPGGAWAATWDGRCLRDVRPASGGDPRWLPHPVVAMGRAITWAEGRLRRAFPQTSAGARAAGLVLAVALPLACGLLAWGILHLCGMVHSGLRFVAEAWASYQILAACELRRQSLAVARAFSKGGLVAAREAVGLIVGRDTSVLDEQGVARAAVETVAENASDGVIAPLFYLMIGGAPLGMAYKAVNTLDSMVGYKNERYIDFGCASARLDDAVNWIPSRLSALLMIAVCPIVGLDARGAARIWRRDRRRHASPNAAQTESACAGALGLRLAGPAVYFGKLVEKPTIGDASREIEWGDIARATRLMLAASVCALVVFGAARAAVVLAVGAMA